MKKNLLLLLGLLTLTGCVVTPDNYYAQDGYYSNRPYTTYYGYGANRPYLNDKKPRPPQVKPHFNEHHSKPHHAPNRPNRPHFKPEHYKPTQKPNGHVPVHKPHAQRPLNDKNNWNKPQSRPHASKESRPNISHRNNGGSRP